MSTITDTPADVEAVIQAAREHASPHVIDPTQDKLHAFVVPRGASLETVRPDDSYLEQPRRLSGAVTLEDAASFKAYVSEFYDAKATTAWVDLDQHRVVGVLNDAQDGASAWRDHRATLQLA
ncbi:MAG: hypothetical protein JWP53_1634, partial [Conexibacter sp.]|nr:hypothetical protein [Conexibacter sp.]